MRFFIDEGGLFIPETGWGVVCSLAIPHKEVGSTRREIDRLSSGWPRKNGELKGGYLHPSHLQALVEVLFRHDAIMHACAVDVSREDDYDYFAVVALGRPIAHWDTSLRHGAGPERFGCPTGSRVIDLTRWTVCYRRSPRRHLTFNSGVTMAMSPASPWSQDENCSPRPNPYLSRMLRCTVDVGSGTGLCAHSLDPFPPPSFVAGGDSCSSE
jgi:hypothetical protein